VENQHRKRRSPGAVAGSLQVKHAHSITPDTAWQQVVEEEAEKKDLEGVPKAVGQRPNKDVKAVRLHEKTNSQNCQGCHKIFGIALSYDPGKLLIIDIVKQPCDEGKA
jgi:hypothetical protein